MVYSPMEVTTYYASMFAARTDAYSRWTPDGWRPTREELTGSVVQAGLTGKGPSVSGFLIAPGSVSHVAAVDFDTENGADQAHTLAAFMAGHSIPAYVETSRRGAHLWVMLDRQAPAVAIRASLRGLLQGAGLPSDDSHIELRPGSDTVADGGLGHALRLPLMPHPKTGRRGVLYDPNGDVMTGNVAQTILAIEWAETDRFLAWAERWVRPPLTEIPPQWRPSRSWPEDDASAAELLRTLWGAADAAPGKVISCPATEYHAHGDRHKGCRVFPDDRRVMCHKNGCVLNNDGRGRGTYELRKLAPGA